MNIIENIVAFVKYVKNVTPRLNPTPTFVRFRNDIGIKKHKLDDYTLIL